MLFDYHFLHANYNVNTNYQVLFDYNQFEKQFGKHVAFHPDAKATGNHCWIFNEKIKIAAGIYDKFTYRSTGELISVQLWTK